MIHVVTVPTPDGPFTILAAERHVLASGWTPEPEELLALVHADLRAPIAPPDTTGPGILTVAREAVVGYYDGDVGAPRRVPVAQRSTVLRESAWNVLREVEPGDAVTYAEYAARCGNPKAVRAAAGACARNAAALFVPCHRIIRSDGTLGGFRYGLAIKESLLRREKAAVQ